MEKIISCSTEDNKNIVYKTTKYWIETNKGIFLDLQMGNSAFIFGFDDTNIIENMNKCRSRFVRNGKNETTEDIKKVIDRLLFFSGMKALSWAVSGTDAIETCLILSEHFWLKNNPNKNNILSLVPSYHGASWLTRSLRREVYNDRCRYVDLPKWYTEEERLLSEKKCLFEIELHFKSLTVSTIIIESIPWVSGIFPFSKIFWKELRILCDRYDVLLILDDVAGCFGKLGKPFSNKFLGIDVDLMAIGKSLSGGYSPISAALINDKIFESISSMDWKHTYTFNPNMSGIMAISSVLDMVESGVFEKTENIRRKMISVFEELKIPNRNDGLCFDIILDVKSNYSKLKNSLLSFNIYNEHSIPIVAPIIADEEYFSFIKKELKKLYEV